MKAVRILALVVCSSFSVCAFGQYKLTAGAVASSCKLIGSNDIAESAISGMCTYLVRGYLDGSMHGADRGLRTAFIKDQKVFVTVNGIDDLMKRLDSLRPSAHCIQPNVKTKDVIAVFVQYVQNNKNRSDEYYMEPLRDSIDEHFCKQ